MTIEKKRAELKIAGEVQGVFFRSSMREQARAHGLGGWVQNMPDGTVEATLEGPVEEIEDVVEWAHHGPEAAKVENIDVQWLDPQGDSKKFQIRR